MQTSFDKESYDRAFEAGFKAAVAEKRADILGDVVNGITTVGKGLAGLPKDIFWGGALTGLATGVGAQAITEHLTKESPEEELNRTLEAMYAAKRNEVADTKWMSKVRAMRAELMADRKKMSVEEYTKKYNALVDALNERKV